MSVVKLMSPFLDAIRCGDDVAAGPASDNTGDSFPE